MGGGSTFFIKYGLIIEYICIFFCFFGVVSQNFLLKIFSRAVDLGGVYTEYLHFGGGSRWDRPKMGGVSIRRPKGAKLVHPPLLDVYDTFPYLVTNRWCKYIPNTGDPKGRGDYEGLKDKA